MKRYPHYKDSGIAWLGEIPQHWVMTSFRRYCDIQLGKMLQSTPNAESDMQVPYLKAAHVQWQGIDHKDLPEMWTSSKDLEKFKVQSGDLLVCEGGEVGRSAILGNIETPTIIQNALHRIRGNQNTFVPFVNYMLRHIADSQWFEILCNKATIAHLTGEKLGDLPLALPPLSEQQAIAAWLDGKTAQIDALIRCKQTLLEKLAEKRGALISHAVTKGLNPAAAMKDSGVAWLGEVPQHWEVKRLKFLGDIILGLTYAPEDVTTDENETLVFRSSNVQDGKLVYTDNVFVSRDIPSKMITKENDILICSRNGSRALIGKCALIDNKGVGQTFGAFMTVFRTPYAKFVYYMLNSDLFKAQLGTFLTATINQLTTQMLSNFAQVVAGHPVWSTLGE